MTRTTSLPLHADPSRPVDGAPRIERTLAGPRHRDDARGALLTVMAHDVHRGDVVTTTEGPRRVLGVVTTRDGAAPAVTHVTYGAAGPDAPAFVATSSPRFRVEVRRGVTQ